MLDLLELLRRGTPPSEEEMAELESEALMGQAVLLGNMNADDEATLLALATSLAFEHMSPEDVQYVLANPQAVAIAAKWMAYMIAGVAVSQEWR